VTVADDLLSGAAWECGATSPGACADPGDLAGSGVDWLAAEVPGTAASALRAAGRWSWGVDDTAVLDGRDWWFRCRFPGPGAAGAWQLELDGLATLADVWLNGLLVLHSDNMFVAHRVGVDALESENEIVIRCASLEAALGRRHGRPRWKSRLVRSQSLRWYRTTLLGRMPGWSRWAAPVGLWRPVRLRECAGGPVIVRRTLASACDASGSGGSVTARIELRGGESALENATLHVGSHSAVLEAAPLADGDTSVLEGVVALDDVARWWPHTHGDQPLYPVALELDGQRIELGSVGFRTIEVDRSDGGFALSVNDVPVFCRGACWGSPDAVSLNPTRAEVRAQIEQARGVGMNMLRIGGYTCYEGADFWEACDELGMLVWQDCMIASVDPPDAPEFAAGFEREVREVFGELAGRPSLAVTCGSSETYQQASMYGLAPGSWDSPLLEHTIPEILSDVVPGIPYVPSSPSGGNPPFSTDVGVTHYFGVGAYLRSTADARLARVRFAAECLSFGNPPEPETVAEAFGDPALAGHDPRWKLTVARDAGTSWDFEDIRDHYVRELFGVDPMQVRYADPSRALDLGRATVCELMTTVLSDWRRGGSSCRGALLLTLRDLWPGAGWGLVDALGRPKAPLYALRPVFAPTAVLITDEGLGGLELHVLHDRPHRLDARLTLRVFNDAGLVTESGEREISLEPHGALSLQAEELLGGFRDLNYAYRFAPLTHDVIAVELSGEDGAPVARTCHLVAGPARPRLPDVGLAATATLDADGDWALTVATRLFAQYVAIDVPGFEPSVSWFHLLPGESTTVRLGRSAGQERPSGAVRCLNGHPVRVEVQREP
jgi:beta-mannosidase